MIYNCSVDRATCKIAIYNNCLVIYIVPSTLEPVKVRGTFRQRFNPDGHNGARGEACIVIKIFIKRPDNILVLGG